MNNNPEEDKATQNEHYAKFPTLPNAWIYIAFDIRHMSLTKVGLTTNEDPKKRISQGITYNPFLKLFAVYELSRCTFGISQKELNDIEGYIQRRAIFGEPLKHLESKRKTEWFLMDPESVESQADWLFAKRGFSVDGYSLYTCSSEIETYHNVVIERMRKIKTIFRPLPDDFLKQMKKCNIPIELVKDYYEYLVEYHQRDASEKVYL